MKSLRRLLWWLGYKPRRERITPEVAEAAAITYNAINEARDIIGCIATKDAIEVARQHQGQHWG